LLLREYLIDTYTASASAATASSDEETMTDAAVTPAVDIERAAHALKLFTTFFAETDDPEITNTKRMTLVLFVYGFVTTFVGSVPVICATVAAAAIGVGRTTAPVLRSTASATRPTSATVRYGIKQLVTMAIIGGLGQQLLGVVSHLHAPAGLVNAVQRHTPVQMLPGLTDLTSERAHQIFAHAAPGRLNEILSMYGYDPFEAEPDRLCCTLGRLKSAPTHGMTTPAPSPPWRIAAIALHDKFAPTSIDAAHYAMEFTWHDPSHLIGVLLAGISQHEDELQPFAVAMHKLGRCPTVLRADLGGAFDNKQFEVAAAAEEGIT